MQTVVVAGGAGFIGSHLVEFLLKQGKRVVVLDDYSTGSKENLTEALREYPTQLQVHEADICTAQAAKIIAESKPEVIYLLAAQWSVKASMRDPLKDAQINVVGLVNILEAARRAGSRKVVFASSGGTIYGNRPDHELPLTEQTTRDPESFYGLTKSVAIDYLKLYKKTFGLETAALALGNVYGPRQSPFGEAGVVSIFARQLLDGQPCVINGDGLTTRDYVFVGDVVRAFAAAGERGSGMYNIGTGAETNVLQIFHKLADILQHPGKPEHSKPLAGEVRRTPLDVTKAKKELGWQAEVGLEQGMKAVVGWLQTS